MFSPAVMARRSTPSLSINPVKPNPSMTTPMDPAQPVMVAGDPQWKYAEARRKDGIPVGPGLLNQVRQIAQAAAAPWPLD